MSTPISSINRNGPIGMPHPTSAPSIRSASRPLSKSSAASSKYGNKTRFTRNPELAENFFLHLHFLRSRFNYELHIPQFHGRRGATNTGATLLCLFLGHQTALEGIAVDFFNGLQTAIDLFARDVT